MKHLLFSTLVAIAFMACSPQTPNTEEQSVPATEQNATPKNHAEYTSPNTAAQQEVFDFIQKKGLTSKTLCLTEYHR